MIANFTVSQSTRYQTNAEAILAYQDFQCRQSPNTANIDDQHHHGGASRQLRTIKMAAEVLEAKTK